MAEDDIGRLGGKRRSIPGASEAEERLLAMVTALTSELAVTRERLDTLERLVESAGVVTQVDMEAFRANEAQTTQRQGLRRRIIAKVFHPLRESAERDLLKVQKARPANAKNDTRKVASK